MKKIQIIILFILCSKVFAATITINGSDGRKIIKSVDNKIEKLFLIQEIPDIQSIDGLDELSNLKYIQISFSDLSNESSSTWKSMKKIETLKMDFCTLNNFEFLNYLPMLKVISFTEGISIADSSRIDLQNNELLEYFEIHINKLDSFPKIYYCPKTLKYVIFNFYVSDKCNIDMSDDINIYVKEEYRYLCNNRNLINDTIYSSLMKKYQI